VAAAAHGLASLSDPARAEPLLRRALAIREKVLGPEHPDVAQDLAALGLLLWSEKKDPKAEEMLQRALKDREKALGPDHPLVVEVLLYQAALLRQTERVAEAKKLEARAQAITVRHAEENPRP
jgi:tetratricopeptide (TPR) repeat protein